MSFPSPGSVGLRSLKLKTNSGTVDLRMHTFEIRVFESMMRPYIVTEISILDTNNFGNTLRIEGGEEITGAAQTAEGTILEISGKAFKQETGDSIGKSIGTVIHFASQPYFGNKSNKVQGAWKNIIGTDLINQISSRYLGTSITNMIPSKGFLAEKEPYILNNIIPLDAISKIRYGLTSVLNSTTGAYTFFENKFGMNLVPLEQLYDTLSPMQYFIQDSTIGSDFLDMKRITKQIISFKAGASFGGSAVDPAELFRNSKVENHKFDLNSKKFTRGMPTNIPFPSLGVSLPGNFNFGLNAGNFSFTLRDSNLRKYEPMDEKAGGEKMLGHTVQGSGTWTMTVLLDRGLRLTAGKGVHATPLLPRGDITGSMSNNNRLGGLALVVNVCHLVKNYDSKPQGFTTVECAQGGFRV